MVVGFVRGIADFESLAWGLGRLMDRVLLFRLAMRWKGWYLEHIERVLHLEKFRCRNKVVDQRVTGIAHRYTVWVEGLR